MFKSPCTVGIGRLQIQVARSLTITVLTCVALVSAAAINSHKILSDVGIDINDALNLMSISKEYHSRIHTDAYILDVNNRLKAVEGSENGVKLVLVQLRLEIAAKDFAAYGY